MASEINCHEILWLAQGDLQAPFLSRGQPKKGRMNRGEIKPQKNLNDFWCKEQETFSPWGSPREEVVNLS